MLHSWWGNGVGVDASEGNWAEGLTTFMADYAYAERAGADTARDTRLRWLRDYAVLPPEREQALTEFRAREHTASQVVGYHKAAFVFLMLRDRIGRAAFDGGVRALWAEKRFRAARWSDLRRAFEKSAGESLEPFFAEWVERRGAPVFAARAASARASGGGFRLSFDLAQTAPAYRLSVPIDIETDGETIHRAVVADSEHTEVEVDLASRPVAIRLDPDFRLFRRLAPAEIPPILRGVAFDLGASTVIAAADDEARAAANAIAAALFETPPRAAAPQLPDAPLLIVGTDEAVRDVLARTIGPSHAASTERGPSVHGRRRPNSSPIVVVAATDANALRAVAGPLPHYGSQSFIVFDGSTRPSGVYGRRRRNRCG